MDELGRESESRQAAPGLQAQSGCLQLSPLNDWAQAARFWFCWSVHSLSPQVCTGHL